MPHHTRSLGALLVAATIAACATVPKVNLQTEEQAIRDLDRRWEAAIAARDIATIMSMYAPDAYVAVPNMPAASGLDATRATWSELVKMPNMSLTFAPTRVVVARSGDLATDVGTYRMSFDGPDGRVNDEGSYTTTWRKIDSQWKASSDMTVSSKPLPPPPAPTPAPTMAVMMLEEGQHEKMTGGTLQWSPLAIPGIPAGAMRAVIHGDPSKSGDFTMRLKFPDKFAVPPHWHPNGEHVTVLQGSIMLGMGEKADRAATHTYGPGDFWYTPPKMPHFGWAKGETTIQINGNGPFTMNLVTPAM